MHGSLAWTIVPAPRAFVESHVAAVHESGNGTNRTSRDVRVESASGGNADYMCSERVFRPFDPQRTWKSKNRIRKTRKQV